MRGQGDQRVLVTYDRGNLELMSPGPFHESIKSLVALFIALVCMELEIPFAAMGSTRWDDPDADRGVEPDDCYYFEAQKVAARNQRSNATSDYPKPNLAIEIDLRGGALDRARIYATLGIAEIWRFDGELVSFERLRDDGTYESVAEGRYLPVRPADVEHWLLKVDTADQAAWMRQVLAWVRLELTERRGRPQAEG